MADIGEGAASAADAADPVAEGAAAPSKHDWARAGAESLPDDELRRQILEAPRVTGMELRPAAPAEPAAGFGKREALKLVTNMADLVAQERERAGPANRGDAG